MYVLQLQKLPFLAPFDAPIPYEAILRSDSIQDLILALARDRSSPYPSTLRIDCMDKSHLYGYSHRDPTEEVSIDRYFGPESIFYDYQAPPEGDYLDTGVILNISTLQQVIQENKVRAEQETIKAWDELIANTVDVTDYLGY